MSSILIILLLALFSWAQPVVVPMKNSKIKALEFSVKANSTADFKDKFQGFKSCPSDIKIVQGAPVPQGTQCLFFYHPKFKESQWSYVPVVTVKAVGTEEIKKDLTKLYAGQVIEVLLDQHKKLSWGEVFYWSTATFGSAHYFYIVLKGTGEGLRIGPIAGSVLANYEIDFAKAKLHK